MKLPIIPSLLSMVTLAATATTAINSEGPHHSRLMEVEMYDKNSSNKCLRLWLDDIDNIPKAEIKNDQQWKPVSGDDETKYATIASYFIQVQHRKNILGSQKSQKNQQQSTPDLSNIESIYTGNYIAPLKAYIKLTDKSFTDATKESKVKGTIVYGNIDYYYRHTKPAENKYKYSDVKEYNNINQEYENMKNKSNGTDSNENNNLQNEDTLDNIKTKIN